MKKNLYFLLVSILTFSTFSSQSLGYGSLAHLTICKIAWTNLNPEAKSRIDSLLGGDSFADQCLWADQVKNTTAWSPTRNYHHMSIDNGQWVGGNLYRALKASRHHLLTGTDLSTNQQMCYLRLLTHLAGDVHQPLHMGNSFDFGGNAIPISDWDGSSVYQYQVVSIIFPSLPESRWDAIYIKPSNGMGINEIVAQNNLHILWDDVLPDLDVKGLRISRDSTSRDPREVSTHYADFLLNLIKKQGQEAYYQNFMNDAIDLWFSTTLDLRTLAYDTSGIEDQNSYVLNRIPVLRDLLLKAGFRLAGSLNAIYSQASTADTMSSKSFLPDEALKPMDYIIPTACDLP